jgi:hypothetical protein
MLPSGGHFVFLECLPATAIVDLFMDYNLCGWGIDADRTQIHGHVSDAIVRFLAIGLPNVIAQHKHGYAA